MPIYDAPAALLRLSTYTDAWRLGTGLPESLPPGDYPVAARRLTPHGTVLELAGGYRVRLPFERPQVDAWALSGFAAAA